MMYLSVKDQLIKELSGSFEPKIKFDTRLRVMSDLLMFNPKEDLSIWNQHKGITPEYFTVYFDGEYICGFDSKQSVERAILDFWRGFKEAYKDGKIHLDPNYKEPTKTVVKKKIKPTTPTEKMAAEIAEKLQK